MCRSPPLASSVRSVCVCVSYAEYDFQMREKSYWTTETDVVVGIGIVVIAKWHDEKQCRLMETDSIH